LAFIALTSCANGPKKTADVAADCDKNSSVYVAGLIYIRPTPV